ncbi:coiled-coil domain-containing protein 74B-like [Dysidea avara]|uniref:coiled-coil domain-containing protein 74B-like n=1 Tax=Dysidea avara TaxID=196820 RepID=UPI003323DBCD
MASFSGGSQFLSMTSGSSSGLWSRPGLNKPHKLHPVNQPKLEPLSAAGGMQYTGTVRQDSLGQNGSQKIIQLEKNIAFLKQQHEQTLSKLHQEIERLMQENRDLNFKVVMTQGGNGYKPCCKSHHSGQEDDSDELRSIMLEEEARQLRNSLINEKNRNARLMRVIEQRRPKSNEPSDGESSVHSSAGSRKFYNGDRSRPPTLAECESIIKHLQQTNDKQSHELSQIKADLKDVLYSHKWTPDAYLIARAYIDDEERPELSTMPPNTANSKQNLMEKAYGKVRENISLPPLRVNQKNFADRHRRMQAVRTKNKTTSSSSTYLT